MENYELSRDCLNKTHFHQYQFKEYPFSLKPQFLKLNKSFCPYIQGVLPHMVSGFRCHTDDICAFLGRYAV
jgi:hypothetical protein